MWKLIASADKNWGIGFRNRLLVQIPSDMQQFREKTLNQIVVMGRKTLESFPNGLALQGRKNVVLTSQMDYRVKNGTVVHGLQELVQLLEDAEETIYVIGGESIYRQLLPYCDTAYITRINHAYACDAYCPAFDADVEWILEEEGEEQTYFDLEYTFQTYVRRR